MEILINYLPVITLSALFIIESILTTKDINKIRKATIGLAENGIEVLINQNRVNKDMKNRVEHLEEKIKELQK